MDTMKRIDIKQQKGQSFLGLNGVPVLPSKPKIEVFNFDVIVGCPFCLSFHKGGDFRCEKGLLVCPECKTKFQKRSVIKEGMTAEDFAEWCFNYAKEGFWQKVPNFKEFCARLTDLKISRQFWDHYKRLKGPTDEEIRAKEEADYQDMLRHCT